MERTIQMHDMSPDSLMQMLKKLLKEEFKQLIQSLKTNEPDEYLTRNEAAEFLKISKTTLWNLDKTQVLPAIRLNGKVLYLKSQLLDFKNRA
ncbi:MAG: helix-turn-helix domain-containing protein [Flavobacteriaceae bacterium]